MSTSDWILIVVTSCLIVILIILFYNDIVKILIGIFCISLLIYFIELTKLAGGKINLEIFFWALVIRKVTAYLIGIIFFLKLNKVINNLLKKDKEKDS